jgi:beta-aspartyl-peptidase (threonine type)
MKTLLLFATLATAAPSSAAEDTSVQQLLDTQVAAWNRKDLAGYMAGYWKSPQLTFYAGGNTTTGWQATFDGYQKRYMGEGKQMGTLSFKSLIVERLGPKVAFARGAWELQMTGETRKGLFTLILKKLPEGWRIVHDHSSIGD